MIRMLDDNELPDGLSYPNSLRRLVERGIYHLEPWYIFDAGQARERMRGLQERFPEKTLLPIARREDNDDVACMDRDSKGKIVIVHDFSSDGWARREVLDDFYAWLRRAVEDMIEFDSMED